MMERVGMKVKLLDLVPQYQSIKEEILKAVDGVLSTQQFILGENVEALEETVAGYCGTKYGVGVASGTDALYISLMALGIGKGDEVITTPFTFFSTVSSIVRAGARPVFVDIDPRTFNIDPAEVEKAITGKTRAIMVVHLFGQAVDMDPIVEAARARGIKIIEDACQSIGALYKGKRVGGIGDVGCFSFFPTKNLGGFGDGGMVVTNDEETAERIKSLRVHGSKSRYYHDEIGINSRLDEIQAAVLLAKFNHLEEWNEMRRSNAAYYDRALEDVDEVSVPFVPDYNRSVYNQYVVRASRRDDLRNHLAREGIGSEVYYPIPLHLQKCFDFLGYKAGDFPSSEEAAGEVLAIPVFPELTDEEKGYVVEKIRSFYSK